MITKEITTEEVENLLGKAINRLVSGREVIALQTENQDVLAGLLRARLSTGEYANQDSLIGILSLALFGSSLMGEYSIEFDTGTDSIQHVITALVENPGAFPDDVLTELSFEIEATRIDWERVMQLTIMALIFTQEIQE